MMGCQQNVRKSSYQKLLNTDSLPVLRVTIFNNKDTIVHTPQGALIGISKGSFSKDTIQLEVREAYTLPQMIFAGLTTESEGKMLSSAGMINLRTADTTVKISKALQIAIPADSINTQMKLYTGKKNKDGKLDWQDPKPLADNFLPGKLLFQKYCATCHDMDKVLSGPALRDVELRGPWVNRANLYRWVKNPAAFIPATCYTINLQKQYGQIMPAYPLPDSAIDAIFDYISNGKPVAPAITKDNDPACIDSCIRYYSLYNTITYKQKLLIEKRENLINENESRIQWRMEFSNPPVVDANESIITSWPDPDKVEPPIYKGVYYQFKINTFDWYNIDRLLDISAASALLTVKLNGYTDKMNVFIVIPDRKVFAEGGPVNNEPNLFGFYSKDGKIPLSIGTKLIVFAVGEMDQGIFFDWKELISSEKMEVPLEPRIMTKK
jgi:hypothetical protein